MRADLDVFDWLPGWTGPGPIRILFTRNRTILVSCRGRRRPRPDAGRPLAPPAREVRVHEIFREAPPEVRAAALSTVLRHPPLPERDRLRRVFREFIHENDARLREISRPSAFVRRAPGPRGETHDLEAILARLLDSGLARPHDGPLLLTWTRRPQRRILGTYDRASGSDPAVIRINRALDDEAVPEDLVAYILHHELLHGEMPSTILDGRRRVHPPEFRRREREFPGWRELDAWEKANFGRVFRNRRRRDGLAARRRASAPRAAAEAPARGH